MLEQRYADDLHRILVPLVTKGARTPKLNQITKQNYTKVFLPTVALHPTREQRYIFPPLVNILLSPHFQCLKRNKSRICRNVSWC